jgi:peptidyl-tRNA hydrolase, PTH1 family
VRLVLGLGNPGERYAATRHNVAWRVLDELGRRWRLAEDASVKGLYQSSRGAVTGETIELMKPETYMNRSGDALRAWMARGGEPSAERLLVVTDDVYLPVGALRMRERGSSGGHRGLESLAAALGHRDFARLRIGVGAAESGAEMREHVLNAFGPEEEPIVERAVRDAADAVECWAREGIERAMNRFNRRVGKEVPES